MTARAVASLFLFFLIDCTALYAHCFEADSSRGQPSWADIALATLGGCLGKKRGRGGGGDSFHSEDPFVERSSHEGRPCHENNAHALCAQLSGQLGRTKKKTKQNNKVVILMPFGWINIM